MTYHLPNGWTVHTTRWRRLPVWQAKVSYHNLTVGVFLGLNRWPTFERAYKAAWRRDELMDPSAAS